MDESLCCVPVRGAPTEIIPSGGVQPSNLNVFLVHGMVPRLGPYKENEIFKVPAPKQLHLRDFFLQCDGQYVGFPSSPTDARNISWNGTIVLDGTLRKYVSPSGRQELGLYYSLARPVEIQLHGNYWRHSFSRLSNYVLYIFQVLTHILSQSQMMTIRSCEARLAQNQLALGFST